MADSRRLIPRNAPETNEDVERRIKRRKRMTDIDEIKAGIDKAEGDIKAFIHKIASLEKQKTKKEQELTAFKKALKDATEIIEDINISKALTQRQEHIDAQMKLFKKWIDQKGHRKIEGFKQPQYNRVNYLINTGVDFNDALARVVSEINKSNASALMEISAPCRVICALSTLIINLQTKKTKKGGNPATLSKRFYLFRF